MQQAAPGFIGLRRPFPDPAELRDILRDRARAIALPAALESRYAAWRERPPAAEEKLRRAQLVMPVEQRLLQRISMGFNLAELEQVETLGYHAYLDRQLDPESIDDGGLEDALHAALPTLGMSPAERLFNYHDNPIVPFFEFQIATLYRSIYSPRQLFERMVIFWTDHFNIDILSDFGIWLKPTDDAEVVRRHALKNFPDLLRASAHSPAMLEYLTNDSNVKEHPNENYPRELLELHAMGADNGYTQEDVREVARCLTGWSFYNYDQGARFGRFFFNAAEHDRGRKVVLGQVIPAGGGIEDGETVLRLLGEHPNTAAFIARKMLRYMWGYEPGEKAVDQVAQTYADTGGDIPEMLRKILTKWRLEDAPPKLKRPYHLAVSAMRSLFAGVNSPGFLLQAILSAGQLPYLWSPPNGYPDAEGYWAGLILPRWNYASEVVTHPESGVTVNLPFLDPDLPAAELAERIDLLLMNRMMTPTTKDVLIEFLERQPITPDRLREALGLALASPEFQRY